MTSRALEKSEWQAYFNKLAKAVPGKQTHVEIVAPAMGDQVLAGSVPMLGIAYEPDTDLLEIALKGFDHLVQHPEQITVEEKEGMLVSFQVIGRDGLQHLVMLSPAFRL